MLIKINIPGKPVPKQGAKFNKSHAYIPSNVKAYERKVRQQAIIAMMSKPVIKGSVSVSITIYRSTLAGFSKKRYEAALRGEYRPVTRPDVDNVAKNILDALKGTIFKDDAQVVDLHVSKYYGKSAHVDIVVEEL